MAIRTLKRRFDPWADDRPKRRARTRYERARSEALASGQDVDICQRDSRGHVGARFRQQTTLDVGGRDYQIALCPPVDDSMERHEERRQRHLSERRRRRAT